MFGTQDLHLVKLMQAERRDDAAKARQAAQHRTMEHHRKTGPRRVLGLRLSFA